MEFGVEGTREVRQGPVQPCELLYRRWAETRDTTELVLRCQRDKICKRSKGLRWNPRIPPSKPASPPRALQRATPVRGDATNRTVNPFDRIFSSRHAGCAWHKSGTNLSTESGNEPALTKSRRPDTPRGHWGTHHTVPSIAPSTPSSLLRRLLFIPEEPSPRLPPPAACPEGVPWRERDPAPTLHHAPASTLRR